MCNFCHGYPYYQQASTACADERNVERVLNAFCFSTSSEFETFSRVEARRSHFFSETPHVSLSAPISSIGGLFSYSEIFL